MELSKQNKTEKKKKKETEEVRSVKILYFTVQAVLTYQNKE
jgi:hypothetical protein